MKKVLFSITLLASTIAANAQITLNQSSFATAHLSGPDTVLTSPTPLLAPPLLPGSAAFAKDMSSYTTNTNMSIIYRVAGTGSNQWADSTYLSFATGFGYKANYGSSITSTGYIQSGIHIGRSALGLATTTLSGALPTDSVVINTQDIAFTAPRTRLMFPATFRSSWTSSYHFDFNFKLTVTNLFYNNTPGIVRSYVTEKDSVIGYGTIQVRTKDGSNSNYINVLQVQSTVSTRDSFFLNGTLMTPSQLALFVAAGTQFTHQGQTTVSNEVYYYRTGELTPALHVTFDSANTHPVSAESQASRMAEAVPETEIAHALNVYPNPVTGHTIMISGTTATYGAWSYELQNIAGQVVNKGALQLNANNAKSSIAVPGTVAPGTYFLHLYNNTNQQTVRKLTIQ